MTRIEIIQKVGPDGVLSLSIPVGMAEANREVVVTVCPVEDSPPAWPLDPVAWRKFIEDTAGSILDPTFERQEQGLYEQRGELFP